MALTDYELRSTWDKIDALGLKSDDIINHVDNAGTNPHGITKANVGLNNAENTADINKVISSRTQTEIDTKEDNLGNPTIDDLVLTSKIDGTRVWAAAGSGTITGIIGVTGGIGVDVDNTNPAIPSISTPAFLPKDEHLQIQDKGSSGKVSFSNLANELKATIQSDSGFKITKLAASGNELSSLNFQDNGNVSLSSGIGSAPIMIDDNDLVNRKFLLDRLVTSGGLTGITAGSGINVNNTDPANPTVSADVTEVEVPVQSPGTANQALFSTGAGSGEWRDSTETVSGLGNIVVDNTDSNNPVISVTGIVAVVDDLTTGGAGDALSADQGILLQTNKEDSLGNPGPGEDGYVLSSSTAGTRDWIKPIIVDDLQLGAAADEACSARRGFLLETGKEDFLTNPSVDGYILTSDTLGTRSWIANNGGITIIDDLTTGGTTDVLSAEQGKVLEETKIASITSTGSITIDSSDVINPIIDLNPAVDPGDVVGQVDVDGLAIKYNALLANLRTAGIIATP